MPPSPSMHDLHMRAAMEQAALGRAAGEVPVGALVVVGDVVVARAFNQPIRSTDPTAHAEVLALREAARLTGNYRLTDATVYVTLEPCIMCVGALIHARVRTVVYGTAEPKTGALVSTCRLLDLPPLNHRFEVVGGVLEDECRDLIQDFFRDRRRAAKAVPESSAEAAADTAVASGGSGEV